MSEARIHLTAHEEVELYVKSTGKDIEYLFVIAYQAYYNDIDVKKIKADLYIYDQTQDPPPYVSYFLRRKLN